MLLSFRVKNYVLNKMIMYYTIKYNPDTDKSQVLDYHYSLSSALVM